MTEREWLECANPDLMLRFLASNYGDRPLAWWRRKTSLVVCACCRRLWPRLSAVGRQGIEVAERRADGLATPQEVKAALAAIKADGKGVWWVAEKAVSFVEAISLLAYSSSSLYEAIYPIWAVNLTGSIAESAEQCALLRDVFGMPFRRPTLDPACLAWGGGLPVAITAEIYEERAFERMPILGDALEEAGCANQVILDHCRQNGGHARGCWLLDLVRFID